MENCIIRYGVATGETHGEMAGYVNEQIAEGWQPHGNVFITTHYNITFIHQPMVMYEVKKKTTRS